MGGRDLVPNPRAHYQYKEADTTGASRGYKVLDDRGMKWDVKLGEEVQPEIVVSRLLWAIGFHQPAVYYMPPGWTIEGAPGWLDLAEGKQNGARFRPDLPNQDVVGEWSWYDNPFVGTRAFKGLVLANLMLSNWDFKANNNRIYNVKPPIGDASRIFVVQDLGASLGIETPRLLHKIRLRSLRGTKGRIEDFERSGFVRRVNGERVELEYHGMDPGLFDNISRADVRWLCGLFSRLSDRQLNDAFRAAGYCRGAERALHQEDQGKGRAGRRALKAEMSEFEIYNLQWLNGSIYARLRRPAHPRRLPERPRRGTDHPGRRLDGRVDAAHIRRHHSPAPALAGPQPRRVLRSAARRRRRRPGKVRGLTDNWGRWAS